MILLSHAHLDDTRCDTLGDGIGIAQWMFGLGVSNFIVSILLMILSCSVGLAAGLAGTATMECWCSTFESFVECAYLKGIPCIVGVVFCFQVGWVIYGSVVVFMDHPDVSGCPSTIHLHAFIVLIITYVIMGLGICIACVKIAAPWAARKMEARRMVCTAIITVELLFITVTLSLLPYHCITVTA